MSELASEPFNTGDGKPAELAEPAGRVKAAVSANAGDERSEERA